MAAIMNAVSADDIIAIGDRFFPNESDRQEAQRRVAFFKAVFVMASRAFEGQLKACKKQQKKANRLLFEAKFGKTIPGSVFLRSIFKRNTRTDYGIYRDAIQQVATILRMPRNDSTVAFLRALYEEVHSLGRSFRLDNISPRFDHGGATFLNADTPDPSVVSEGSPPHNINDTWINEETDIITFEVESHSDGHSGSGSNDDNSNNNNDAANSGYGFFAATDGEEKEEETNDHFSYCGDNDAANSG